MQLRRRLSAGGLSAVVFQAAPSPATKRLNSHPVGGSTLGFDSQSCPCAWGWEQPPLLWSLPEIAPRLPGIRDKGCVHSTLAEVVQAAPPRPVHVAAGKVPRHFILFSVNCAWGEVFSPGQPPDPRV